MVPNLRFRNILGTTKITENLEMSVIYILCPAKWTKVHINLTDLWITDIRPMLIVLCMSLAKIHIPPKWLKCPKFWSIHSSPSLSLLRSCCWVEERKSLVSFTITVRPCLLLLVVVLNCPNFLSPTHAHQMQISSPNPTFSIHLFLVASLNITGS